MYKIIKIGGNDYKFEFTIEASLYEEFVERLTKFTTGFSGLMAKNEIKGETIKNDNDLINASVEVVEDMLVKTTTQIPRLALEGFYAGLLEHHHLAKQDAKQLYIKYMQEYNKTPKDILTEIIEKVKDDNFFQLIGLDLTKIVKKKEANSKRKKTTEK